MPSWCVAPVGCPQCTQVCPLRPQPWRWAFSAQDPRPPPHPAGAATVAPLPMHCRPCPLTPSVWTLPPPGTAEAAASGLDSCYLGEAIVLTPVPRSCQRQRWRGHGSLGPHGKWWPSHPYTLTLDWEPVSCLGSHGTWEARW